MAIRIHSGHFASISEVLDDIKAHGMWPTTFVSGRSDGLDVHWHDHDVYAYVMEGEDGFPRRGVRREAGGACR